MFRPILLMAVLTVNMAHASNGADAAAGCENALVRLSDEDFARASQPFALLFDQVIKNGGAHVGPLLTRLTYLSHQSPEIRDILEKMQAKVETLLNTAPGTTIINMGFMVQVDDPYANQPGRELAQDSDLLMLLLNGKFSAVGPELTPDRGRDEDRIVNFGGLKVMTTNYKLKDRLTPPVNDFVMAALVVTALSNPKNLNSELSSYPNLMLLPWNTLDQVTEYLKAVAKTTASGHFSDVNEAIENVTLENAASFGNIQLPPKI